jgi:hypothetical protein
VCGDPSAYLYVKCYAVTPLRFVPGDGDGVGILEAIPGPWIPLDGLQRPGLRIQLLVSMQGRTPLLGIPW